MTPHRISSDAAPPPGGASRGLTPAAAYRASVTGADRNTGGSAAAGGGGGGGVGAGGSSRLGPDAFNAGDMDDSIMRGPGRQKDDYAAELAWKFRYSSSCSSAFVCERILAMISACNRLSSLHPEVELRKASHQSEKLHGRSLL